jgi:hypothetical protein
MALWSTYPRVFSHAPDNPRSWPEKYRSHLIHLGICSGPAVDHPFVLLTYTTKEPKEKLRVLVGVIVIAGTFIGVDAAFWHISWLVGIVFLVVSLIAFALGWYYLFF